MRKLGKVALIFAVALLLVSKLELKTYAAREDKGTYIGMTHGGVPLYEKDDCMSVRDSKELMAAIEGCNLTPAMSDYEKAVCIGEYINRVLEYDRTYSIYDSVEALRKGRGVCLAYSYLYNQLLTAAGIENSFEGHFNAVYCDGHIYYADLTNVESGHFDLFLTDWKTFFFGNIYFL